MATSRKRKDSFPYGAKYDKQLKEGKQIAKARYHADLRSTAKDLIEERKEYPDQDLETLIDQQADSAVIYTKDALDIMVESDNWTAIEEMGELRSSQDVSALVTQIAYWAYRTDLEEYVRAFSNEGTPTKRKGGFPYGAKYDKQLKQAEEIARARYHTDLKSTAKDLIEERKEYPDQDLETLIDQQADSAVIYTKDALDIMVESDNWTAIEDMGELPPSQDVSALVTQIAYWAYHTDLEEYVQAFSNEDESEGNPRARRTTGSKKQSRKRNGWRTGASTVRGTYGSRRTPADIYVYVAGDLKWYAVDGSVNVNAVYADTPLEDGVDVEILQDVDTFTADSPIESEDDLVAAVDDVEPNPKGRARGTTKQPGKRSSRARPSQSNSTSKGARAQLSEAGWTKLKAVPGHRGWFEGIDPDGDPAVVLKQSKEIWHVFYKPRATASGRSAATAPQGWLTDAVSTEEELSRYCELVKNGPQALAQKYDGLYEMMRQCSTEGRLDVDLNSPRARRTSELKKQGKKRNVQGSSIPRWPRGGPAPAAKVIIAAANEASREEIIAWLQWADPNGVWTDAAMEREGWEPMTLQDARQKVEEMVAEL